MIQAVSGPLGVCFLKQAGTAFLLPRACLCLGFWSALGRESTTPPSYLAATALPTFAGQWTMCSVSCAPAEPRL